jgi:hypothetical protein
MKLFDGSKENQICGEASTVYLYDHELTIKNYSKKITDWDETKIIILLRNPINRAFSHYMNEVRSGYEKKSFREAIELCLDEKAPRYRNYLEYGLYSQQVKSYIDNFKHVKIVIFEQLIKKHHEIVSDIFSFLECSIDDGKLCELKKENVSGRPKSTILSTLLYTDNSIKSFIKLLLPKDIRRSILKKISNKILVKEKINTQDKEYLKQYYQDEIASLEGILGYQLQEWK